MIELKTPLRRNPWRFFHCAQWRGSASAPPIFRQPIQDIRYRIGRPRLGDKIAMGQLLSVAGEERHGPRLQLPVQRGAVFDASLVQDALKLDILSARRSGVGAEEDGRGAAL